MSDVRSVVMVVPADADDPRLPSGGNVYDRRLCAELRRSGWSVSWRGVPGDWPASHARTLTALRESVADVPDGSVVLVDGLVACGAPDVITPWATRLRVVVLVHMPLGQHTASPRVTALEALVLRAAESVVTTSEWCRRWLLTTYELDPSRVVCAQPGADQAAVSRGSLHGGNLLCVASVARGKGHDVLLAALSRLTDLVWQCQCVGTLRRDPGFVAQLRQDVRQAGLAYRLSLVGPRTDHALEVSYAEADLLVLPSRAETWGMVVTEALAHGLPVVASDVGGVPEALGADLAGVRPGVLVEPGDAGELAEALRAWLTEPGLREALRSLALQRRAEQPGWDVTVGRVAALLTGVAA